VAIVRIGTTDGLHDLESGTPVGLPGLEIGAIARSGDDWLAVTDGSTLMRSEADGWREVARLQGRGNCLLPTPGGVLVGTAEAHLLLVTSDGDQHAVSSFEEVDGRGDWYTPWGGPPDVRSISSDRDGVIYANVHVGGIPRSNDGGVSWSPTIEVDADVHQVLAHRGTVFAPGARGLAVSDDGGRSWRIETDGLHARYARAVAVAGDWVLVSVSRGPRGGQAAVYRRPVQGGDFERCEVGLPQWFDRNIDTHCLAALDQEAVFGTDDGRVFRSTDGGGAWELMTDALPPVTCVAMG